ncbi:nucleotidyltransferase [Nocardioides solisilvae]|uniref:nucleotidyltransferase n=1 Tax=Nocardioides solisilvae TaxID=1542435 RepID=UPI000D744870|nr:nucleotidyltransferase [Nocardioides solisilvae]
MLDEEQANLREALKRVAVALKQSGLPFALAGGYAVWARGGPEPSHDVDFLVAESDAPAAATALAEQGMQVVQPPEDWLFKVFTDDVMVDVFHRDATIPAEREMLADADEIEVISVVMPVLSATRLMVHKLHAMDERYCDFGKLLPVARALREQVDWAQVRKETDDNEFAVAFLFLLERLRIVETA